MKTYKQFLSEANPYGVPAYSNVKKQKFVKSGFFDENLAMHIKSYTNTGLNFTRDMRAEGKTWRWQKAWDRVWIVEKNSVTYMLVKELLPDDKEKPWQLFAFSDKVPESEMWNLIHKLDSHIHKN